MMKIRFISTNDDGNFYVGEVIPVQRGIKGKNKSVVNELLIIGMHRSRFKKWLKDHIDEMEFIGNDDPHF